MKTDLHMPIWARHLLVCVATLPIILSTACIGHGATASVSAFRQFSIEEGFAHYSFEYPSAYVVTDKSFDTNISFVEISGARYPDGVERTFIKVMAGPPARQVATADQWIDLALSKAAGMRYFRLIDDSGVLVDGNQGRLIVYTIMSYLPIPRNDGQPPIDLYRRVAFNQGGLIWILEQQTDNLTAQADKAAFDHVLQTFKILN